MTAPISAPDTCGWFALCIRPSVVLVQHPAGDIPVCIPCLRKLDELSSARIWDDVVAVADGTTLEAVRAEVTTA